MNRHEDARSRWESHPKVEGLERKELMANVPILPADLFVTSALARPQAPALTPSIPIPPPAR